jgi:hypothetical protein
MLTLNFVVIAPISYSISRSSMQFADIYHYVGPVIFQHHPVPASNKGQYRQVFASRNSVQERSGPLF